MSLVPWMAILLAGAPVLNAPQPAQRPLVEKLQLAESPPDKPAACPDLSRPLTDEQGLACASRQAHFARAVWRAPRLTPLRLRRVGFVSGYQSPQRPELPLERTLYPWAGFQLRLDLMPPR